MKRLRLIVLAVVLLSMLILQSCDTQMVYDQYLELDDNGWRWTDGQEFAFDMEDTESLHNIYVKVRHGVDYPYQNLYMFIHLKGPGDLYQRDTVNLILAGEDGRWVGRGNAHLKELNLLYRKQIRFPAEGSYSITLEQAMRRERLPVTDLGIRIERIKED